MHKTNVLHIILGPIPVIFVVSNIASLGTNLRLIGRSKQRV